jgi:FAD/FMN-containing dehydrogenase
MASQSQGEAAMPGTHTPGRRTGRRVTLALSAGLVLAVTCYASSFAIPYGNLWRRNDPLVREDVARLLPTRIQRIEHIGAVEDLQQVVMDAARLGLHVSISGSRHSQGGHTYTENGVVLDMRGFNRVLAVDTVARTVTVESGATWDEVQRAIAPYGLAIKVMQSSNVFTVGGTLSANAHGRDIDVTQVVQVVRRFGLLLADGRIVEVSRVEHPELFSLVIGGYGLYGVILDVTVGVTRDVLLEQHAVSMDYADFPAFFASRVKSDSSVAMLIARPSIDPRMDRFMREMVVVTWRRVPPGREGSFTLTEESHVMRDRFFFGLSRRFDWAKSLRWALQKRFEPTLGDDPVSRNNAMRPPLAPVAFLDYRSSRDTDILQEYFVPVARFVPFMDRFRSILSSAGVNVLSVTVRYVAPDSTPVMAYAPQDEAFAIVLLCNVGLSDDGQARAREFTRALVDAALEELGTYYLTYQLYPTPAQLHRAYPNAAGAFERKRFYDPEETFTSLFYQQYGHGNPG